MKIKKLKLKKEVTDVGKYILIGFVILIAIFIFLFTKKLNLQKLGYSKKASSVIVRKFKWNKVSEIGENKTLNAAFESSAYKEENFEHYKNIEYQNLIPHLTR